MAKTAESIERLAEQDLSLLPVAGAIKVILDGSRKTCEGICGFRCTDLLGGTSKMMIDPEGRLAEIVASSVSDCPLVTSLVLR